MTDRHDAFDLAADARVARVAPGEAPIDTMSSSLILVADDEPRIARLMSIALTTEGFRVVIAQGGENVLARAEELRPDAILLDLSMPGLDGFEVLSQLKARRSVPIILISARASYADKAEGLDMGADDYIAKPFHPDELVARVRAQLRRASPHGIVAFDDIEIDLDLECVRRSGETVGFSRTEWMLLEQLAKNAGRVGLASEILTKAWGPEYSTDVEYLRVWINRVRRQLGAVTGQPGRIKTFPGIGYCLDVENPGERPPHHRSAEHHRRPRPTDDPAGSVVTVSRQAEAVPRRAEAGTVPASEWSSRPIARGG